MNFKFSGVWKEKRKKCFCLWGKKTGWDFFFLLKAWWKNLLLVWNNDMCVRSSLSWNGEWTNDERNVGGGGAMAATTGALRERWHTDANEKREGFTATRWRPRVYRDCDARCFSSFTIYTLRFYNHSHEWKFPKKFFSFRFFSIQFLGGFFFFFFWNVLSLSHLWIWENFQWPIWSCSSCREIALEISEKSLAFYWLKCAGKWVSEN